MSGSQTAVKPLEGITFGCDPEFFIIDENGEGVCPDGLIPGTKEDPFKVDGGAIQMDGMAAEINTDPVDNFEDFQKNFKKVMKSLGTYLPKGTKLSKASSIIFTEKVWEESPDHCKMLGCSPDFNAWTKKQNNVPDRDAIHPRLCTTGGHAHFGWTSDADMSDPAYLSACVDLVRQLDWFTGFWSNKFDKDSIRRGLYGKAGSMRFKSYGVEYRTPSNFWLTSPAKMLGFWNRCHMAVHKMRNNYVPEVADQAGFGNGTIIEAINTCDNKLINSSMKEFFHFPLNSVDY